MKFHSIEGEIEAHLLDDGSGYFVRGPDNAVWFMSRQCFDALFSSDVGRVGVEEYRDTVDEGPRLDTFAGIDPPRQTWCGAPGAVAQARPLHVDLPRGTWYDPTEPTGAEKLAAALAARTEPGRAPEAAVYAPEAVDQAIADVRTQVEEEGKKREEEGITMEGGNRDPEIQRAGVERRRQGRSKGHAHGKPCPKCPRRNGPRSKVCACGYSYYPSSAKKIVIAPRRSRRG